MVALLVPMTPVVKMSSCACGVLENEVTVPPLVVVVVAMSFSRECFFYWNCQGLLTGRSPVLAPLRVFRSGTGRLPDIVDRLG
ncbi:hypothetical protein SRABI130_05521 [Pseudomonas sp. Bi130]|nr:hypothetical protein SRABI130_05521 [Pseudomonas sp. Bi130]